MVILFTLGNLTLSFAQIFPFKEIGHGEASYYAQILIGGRTANGEILSEYGFTAAHRTLEFGTLLRITNLDNGRSTVVRINDRGPYNKTRIIDLNRSAAKCLGMMRTGTAKVRLDSLDEICISPEAEQGYKSGNVVDAMGNPSQFKNFSVLVWDTVSLQHCLYMTIDLYMRTGNTNICLQRLGNPDKSRYRIFFTAIESRQDADKLVDKLLADGFGRASVQAEK